MPLDAATLRLRDALGGQVLDLRDVAELRALRAEELRYDAVAARVTRQTRHGEIVGRWHAELVGTYVPRDSLFRWAWAGATSSSATFGERIFREGQARDVPQLSMSVVGSLTEDEASTLAYLGFALSGAVDAYIEEGDGIIKYYGMFESPRPSGMHVSVPPPAVRAKRAVSPVPSAPLRSLPPRSSTSPEGPAAKRSAPPPPLEAPIEPERVTFFPVASLTHELLARATPGFSQAVLSVTVDVEAKRPRLIVQVAAVDAAGRLRAVAPSRELLEAALKMVTIERERGAGNWQKLEAHLAPKENGGATLEVEVV